MKLIDRLMELEKAATPGPWAIAIESGMSMVMTADYTKDIGTDADLDFIIEMRNALPKLLAVVEAAQSVILEARDSSGTLWCAVERRKVEVLKAAFAALDENSAVKRGEQ